MQNIVSPVSYDSSGNVQTNRAGNVVETRADFTPSQYDADLTMDGTAQSVALATGATKVFVTNLGAAGEYIRIAFGTSAANAESNLTISSGAATTGHVLGANSNGNGTQSVSLGVPTDATHYAVANGVALDTQVVSITQGV